VKQARLLHYEPPHLQPHPQDNHPDGSSKNARSLVLYFPPLHMMICDAVKFLVASLAPSGCLRDVVYNYGVREGIEALLLQ
jgi:hypothetical protein